MQAPRKNDSFNAPVQKRDNGRCHFMTPRHLVVRRFSVLPAVKRDAYSLSARSLWSALWRKQEKLYLPTFRKFCIIKIVVNTFIPYWH